jgi:hypothetical protein
MDVLRSFETRAEAVAEAERLAAEEPQNLESDAA